MGPTWGPPGCCRPQMGPMMAPWTLLSGMISWFQYEITVTFKSNIPCHGLIATQLYAVVLWLAAYCWYSPVACHDPIPLLLRWQPGNYWHSDSPVVAGNVQYRAIITWYISSKIISLHVLHIIVDNWYNPTVYNGCYHLSMPGLKLIQCYPDSKVHGANKGPTWVLSAPDGPHVGPINLAISVVKGGPVDCNGYLKGYSVTNWS